MGGQGYGTINCDALAKGSNYEATDLTPLLSLGQHKQPSHGEELRQRASSSGSQKEANLSILSSVSCSLTHVWGEHNQPSLSEAFMTVAMPGGDSDLDSWMIFFKQLWSFCGVGLMVAVGYMDPGNWATDLEGGSKFEYTLLSMVFVSNLMAIFLQHLALKLGVAAEMDLAQVCRCQYSRTTNFLLWIGAEIAIAACDLAEVIGSAVALKLLFGIPLILGVILTALDVLLILFIEQKNFRILEFIVGSIIVVISSCFAYELYLARPQWSAVLEGIIPYPSIVTNRDQLLVSIGILGATVMPHNLYLHSSIVQTRAYIRNHKHKCRAIQVGTIDSTIALFFAFFVNAAILVLSAAAFHGTPNQDVTEIADAFKLLSPTLGSAWASVIFAVALLGSGQNSTITGTLAGQIVMEGFMTMKLKPWARRLLSRSMAVVPAAVVAALAGERGVGQLLLLSQVMLSMQLSFAVVPLMQFTGDPKIMGSAFVNSFLMQVMGWTITAIIILLNTILLVLMMF
eukprot:GGOE01006552.1.p1 GENE.GGOE01006552.1~~GGOE01006552.1.p1  ORF type:complete len:513 (-),score=119.24 GGOE01006552.1:321-1859(-)